MISKRLCLTFISLMTVLGSITLHAAEDEQSSRDRQTRFGESRSETFAVSPGGTLDVASSVGDIVITARERNEVVITAVGIDREDLADLSMTKTDNRIRVDYRPRGRRWSSRIRFEIDIPGRFNLDLRTGGGEIEVLGALNGNMRGKTSGGDMRVDDVSGELDLSTSGGDIRAGKIGGRGYLQTSGGDIRVESAVAILDVRTSGGDIIIGNVGNRLDASTSGGDIEIGDVGGDVSLSTSGGDIEVGRISGGATLTTAGGTIRLRSASGEVRARTAGGDVELENVTGSVEAETAGGDIMAELIPKGTGRSALITAGGRVTLYIPADARATIEARIRIQGGRSRERWWNDRDRDRNRRPDYEIRSDFKANQYEAEAQEVRATYVLNGGGERIRLETTNGHIEIRQMTPRR